MIYCVDIIPIVLNIFKVNTVVLNGNLDDESYNQVLKYSKFEDCNVTDLPQDENSLNILSDLNNYDAIFINDDPNWYTVFNELNIIKQNNDDFPLVFICHNIFPHKRRDSYKNPNIIPKDFINEYSKNLEFSDISIKDGFYHAINENTPKNGVLTAIEDFLSENSSIGVMNFNLLNGIVILYPLNSISQIRLGKLSEEVKDYEFDYDFADDIVGNLLLNNFKKFNFKGNDLDLIDNFKIEINQKEQIIQEYKDKIELHNNELSLKNFQLDNIGSELNVKDAQIKNIESKLVNYENDINILNNKLQDANNQINSLKSNLSQKEQIELELNNKLGVANNQINSLKSNLSQKETIEFELNNQLNYKEDSLHLKDDVIKIKQKELHYKEILLKSFERKYTNQLSKLDTKEYCISCYKEQITNNHLEIEYLKKDTVARKIFSPLSYVYLIFKSKPKEISLNIKLYNALKNSKCFDIGFYLNNNVDLINSKWCKFFSPELHYVCNGFYEQRKFNKKYFNRTSKEELLDYIINCP